MTPVLSTGWSCIFLLSTERVFAYVLSYIYHKKIIKSESYLAQKVFCIDKNDNIR